MLMPLKIGRLFVGDRGLMVIVLKVANNTSEFTSKLNPEVKLIWSYTRKFMLPSNFIPNDMVHSKVISSPEEGPNLNVGLVI